MMTAKQKADIIALRSNGATYSDIAEKLQLSVNTVKSFYRRCKENIAEKSDSCCKYCDKPVVQTTATREKKFCSDECRMKWWKSHSGDINRKALYDFKCEYCGKLFQAYGNNHRKYCSRDCYIKMRFGGGGCEQ